VSQAALHGDTGAVVADTSVPTGYVVTLRNGPQDWHQDVCTGVMLSPRVVLTSHHCLDDQPSYAEFPVLGAAGPLRVEVLSFQVGDSVTPFPGDPDDVPDSDDLMILYLAEWRDVADFDSVFQTKLQRPSFTRGPGPVSIAVNGAAPARWMASWDDISYNDGVWSGATRGDEKNVYVAHGDSGSPLFTTRADGSRDVFGILASHDNYNGEESGKPRFTDLTRSHVYSSSTSGARRSRLLTSLATSEAVSRGRAR